MNQINLQYNEDPYIDDSNINHHDQDVYLGEIIHRINSSKTPILYIGQGCNHASKELTELILKNKYTITTTMHAMEILDETHPLSLKNVGCMDHILRIWLLQNADCIIGIGARFDDRTTGNIEHYAPYS